MKKIENKIESARQGREEWLQLEQKYRISQDEKMQVLLYPEKDTEFSRYSMKYLNEFEKEYGLERILAIACDRELLRNLTVLKVDSEILIEEFSEEKIGKILDYYRLTEFTKKMKIISLDLPEGRYGRESIGVQGITKEEVIRIGILGIGANYK